MDSKPSYTTLLEQIATDPIKKQLWIQMHRVFYDDPVAADLWNRLLTHMQMKTPTHPRQELWKALNNALSTMEDDILADLPPC